MPRSPLPRTLLAILPIFGALLAALAAHQRWPIPLSLFAMAVVASASAVIYWSAPLAKREPAEIAKTAEQAQPPALPKFIPVLTAAAQPQAAAAPAQIHACAIRGRNRRHSGRRADHRRTARDGPADRAIGLRGVLCPTRPRTRPLQGCESDCHPCHLRSRCFWRDQPHGRVGGREPHAAAGSRLLPPHCA